VDTFGKLFESNENHFFMVLYGRGITAGIDNNPRHYSKFRANPINQSCGHQNSKVFEIVHKTRYYFVIITCVI